MIHFKDPDSFHSSSLANEFIRKFRSIEGMVTDVISITSDTVDFDVILPHLREKNVQLLYLPVAAKNIVAISKALEKIAWEPEEMAGDGTLATVLAGYPEEIDFVEGLLAIDLYSHNLEITPYVKTSKKIFHSLYKPKGSTLSASGFEGMTLLMNGLNQCKNSSDKECINREIHSTVDFKGLMGKITIQPNGKALRSLLVNRIRDGKLEFVLKVH